MVTTSSASPLPHYSPDLQHSRFRCILSLALHFHTILKLALHLVVMLLPLQTAC